MPVQLLPFQKIVDMPNLAQHHRRTICGLAIASIVLIFSILCILVPTFIAGFTMTVYPANTLLTFVGIPSMVIILILVCTSSCISLRNTDRWASTDTCCNLMRSNPTCCTKCCAGNKHCCARMSCLHIAASVWTILSCVLLVVLLFAGCNESDSITRAFESKYPSRRPAKSLRSLAIPYKYGIQSSAAWRSHCVGDGTECTGLCGAGYTLITTRDDCEAAAQYLRETSASITVRVYYDDYAPRGCSLYGSIRQTNPAPVQFGSKFDQLYSDGYCTPICVRVGSSTHPTKSATKAPLPTTKYTTPPRDKVPARYRDYHYGSGYRYQSTTERRDNDNYYSWERDQYESSKHICSLLAGSEVPAIALMICLAITTAISARLLRRIEQAQPEIELLPAGKLVVVQTCEYAVPALIKANVIEDAAQVTNDVNSTPGLETEQNE